MVKNSTLCSIRRNKSMFSRGLLGSVIDMGFTYIRQFQSYCINTYVWDNNHSNSKGLAKFSLFKYTGRVLYLYWTIPILLYQNVWDKNTDSKGLAT